MWRSLSDSKEEEEEDGGRGEVAASTESDFSAVSGSLLKPLTLASLLPSRLEEGDNGASCTASGVLAVN